MRKALRSNRYCRNVARAALSKRLPLSVRTGSRAGVVSSRRDPAARDPSRSERVLSR